MGRPPKQQPLFPAGRLHRGLDQAEEHVLAWGPWSARHALPADWPAELVDQVEQLLCAAILDRSRLAALADQHGELVTERWVKARPGTRPWCWWAHLAPAELRGEAGRTARRASVDDSGTAPPEAGLLRAFAVLTPAERRRLRAPAYRRVECRRAFPEGWLPPPLEHELPQVEEEAQRPDRVEELKATIEGGAR